MTQSILVTVTSSSFLLVFFAFVATAIFLILERSGVPERFKTAMSLSTAYIVIAAMSYYVMRDIYTGDTFPTYVRYIDWWLTTPLMLLEFPILLGLGERGRPFMIRLVLLDIGMITAGFFGELFVDNKMLHNGLFLLGCAFWFVIIWMMFSALSQIPDHVSPAVKRGVRSIGVLLVFGWAVYPAGYFAPAMDLPGDARELLYNFADLINKVGLCILVYLTAKAAQAEDEAIAYQQQYGENEQVEYQ